MRQNLAPILLIQAAGAAMVIFYFQSPGFQEWASGIAKLKASGGSVFAFIAGFIAGGIIPEIAKFLTGRGSLSRVAIGKAAWAGLVYGTVGIVVDIFYLAQGRWFGTGTDIGTLAIKVAVDMLIFAPFLSIPQGAMLFGWWKSGFKSSFWKRAFTVQFYKEEVATAMPLCWAFWIPMLVCTYALPMNLQFPFAILAESAWSILFVFLVTNDELQGL